MEPRLEAVRRDLATRKDTSGEKFAMVIDGQEIRDRGIAGELLLRRAEKLRSTRVERRVGTLGGFQVWIADNFMTGPEFVVRGTTFYQATVTDTAHGMIRSVEYVIQHLEEIAESLTRNLADARKRLADAQTQVYAPFEYAERLAELAQCQQQIEDELDLTKNPASAQLCIDPNAPSPASEPDTDCLKEPCDGDGW